MTIQSAELADKAPSHANAKDQKEKLSTKPKRSPNRKKNKKSTFQHPRASSSNDKGTSTDENLPPTTTVIDPRDGRKQRLTKEATKRGHGRNTESFDPSSTWVRPELRIHVGSPNVEQYPKTLKHDDVVIVPELFGSEEDWSMYHRLVEEMTALQNKKGGNDGGGGGNGGCEWISWHEGAHLICKNPEESKTFQSVIDRLCDYFQIRKSSIGTRLNWYKDGRDWKPFHHDSAAFNAQRAKNQNITVGVSFGATRELAFLRAPPRSGKPSATLDKNYEETRIYFPQTNNGVFSFGRDVNIHWKHGINALKPEEQDEAAGAEGKGRISIILWGLAQNVLEEEGSPPLLGSDGKGPHAAGGAGTGGRNHNKGGNRRRSRGFRKGGKLERRTDHKSKHEGERALPREETAQEKQES